MAHTAEVNCEPLSEVMAAGTPKRAIQPRKRARAQSAGSMMVKWYVQPSEASRGPTRSTCTWLKRLHVHVLGDLATLAREARTGPRGDVSCCTLPDKPQKNETIPG